MGRSRARCDARSCAALIKRFLCFTSAAQRRAVQRMCERSHYIKFGVWAAKLFSVSAEFRRLCTNVDMYPDSIDVTPIHLLRCSVYRNFTTI